MEGFGGLTYAEDHAGGPDMPVDGVPAHAFDGLNGFNG
jgi:hypothetical protein